MSDERSLKTVKEAKAARGKVQQRLSQMRQEWAAIHIWLQETREIVEEWITAACQVKFKQEKLNDLWRPISKGASAFNAAPCRSWQAEVLDRLKQAAAALVWAKLVAQDDISPNFPEKVLAAVRLLESIDAILARCGQGDFYRAFECFETLDLTVLEEQPNPYEENGK